MFADIAHGSSGGWRPWCALAAVFAAHVQESKIM
jgi:hypothetical protein